LPKVLRDCNVDRRSLNKLPRVVKRLALRVEKGLPDDVLWMNYLNFNESEMKLSRDDILSLRKLGAITPEDIMSSSSEMDKVREKAFEKVKPSPQQKANWLRDACRTWKVNHRKWIAKKHIDRAKRCKSRHLVEAYYNEKGKKFEKIFEEILSILEISFERLDDKGKTGAPDYLVKFDDSPELIIELKSREGDKLVDFNKAVKVLGAAEIHGFKDSFCVTLCHPGVDPSVPTNISSCDRLSVVESPDLGEALLRLCEGSLNKDQVWQWLATPGQALISDLPYRDYKLR
jgi:helicase